MNTGNGIFLPNRDTSSTADFSFHPLPSEIRTARNENSTTSNIPPEQYHYLLTQIDGLNARIKTLEKSAQTTSCFAKQSVILQRICIIVIFVLPFIVAAAAAGIVWLFSTDESLINFAKGYLGVLGFSGLLDFGFLVFFEKNRTAQLKDLDQRIEKLEK